MVAIWCGTSFWQAGGRCRPRCAGWKGWHEPHVRDKARLRGRPRQAAAALVRPVHLADEEVMANFITRLRQSWEEELQQRGPEQCSLASLPRKRYGIHTSASYAETALNSLSPPPGGLASGGSPGRPRARAGVRRQIVARLPADRRQRLVPADLPEPPLARAAGGAGVKDDGAGLPARHLGRHPDGREIR